VGYRLDCHQYFWSQERVTRGDYPWMPDDGLLREDYDPGRLEPELSKAGVGGTILIQAAHSLEETRFLLGLATETESVLGVTGWVPLDRADALETLGELAKNEYLKAVRSMIHDLPDPLWITRPQVRRNLHGLADLGQRFEVLTYSEHLPAVYDVLAAIPELPAVINHISKPVYLWGDDGDWRHWMARHAQRPNTYCKLSGMFTEVGPQWTDEGLRPYVDYIFEWFGTDRVIFGSDWPVSRQIMEYPQVVKATSSLVSSLSPDEAEAFWRTNGEQFYGVRIEPGDAGATSTTIGSNA
jgi:L-fuconolactonase